LDILVFAGDKCPCTHALVEHANAVERAPPKGHIRAIDKPGINELRRLKRLFFSQALDRDRQVCLVEKSIRPPAKVTDSSKKTRSQALSRSGAG
jgi:hypothetical protein